MTDHLKSTRHKNKMKSKQKMTNIDESFKSMFDTESEGNDNDYFV